MNSVARFGGRARHDSAYDPKTKCGDIVMSFKTLKFEFICSFCHEERRYNALFDFYNHVTTEHTPCPEEDDSAISVYGDYTTGKEVDDPLPHKVSKTDEDEDEIKVERDDRFVPDEIKIEYEEENEDNKQPNHSIIRMGEPLGFTISAVHSIGSGDITFTQLYSNYVNHCNIEECKEIDETKRQHIVKLIDMYRKSIGLWHTKTASHTPDLLKTAACRLMGKNYEPDQKVSKVRLILRRMTACFNAAWKANKKGLYPWYFDRMKFLQFADDEVIPDKEFYDFQCPFCMNEDVTASGSVELWEHIVEYHKDIGDVVESEPNPMKWTKDHIMKFIQIYREHSSLWDTKCREYYDSTLKEKAYQTVIEKFNKVRPNSLKSQGSVKRTVRLLQFHFSGADRKYQSSSVLNKTEKVEINSDYKIYKELLFLKNITMPQQYNFNENYTCELCDKRFVKKCFMFEHFKAQHKNSEFRCDKCPMAFSCEENLNSHRRKHDDDGGNSYSCPICHLQYSNSEELDTHLSEHVPDKTCQQVCKICGAIFKDRCNLLIHLRRHCKIKHYVCKFCPVRFVTSSELKFHSYKHTHDTPFVCEVCGLTFRYPSVMVKHRLTHEESRFKDKKL